MQEEILDIIEKNIDKFEHNWVHQTELITLIQKQMKLEFTPVISNGLCKLREWNDLKFIKITHENYKRMLKKIKREELIKYPSLFKRYTYFYCIFNK